MSQTNDVLPEQMEPTFVPEDLDVEEWGELEPYLEQLADLEVETDEQVRAYLDKWNEFDAVVSEKAHRLRLEKAMHVDDEEVGQRWLSFVQTISPKLSEWNDRLGRKLVESPVVEGLEGSGYEAFVDEVRVDVELFRQENVPLQRELAELSTRYGELSGNWMVEFEGEERTFSAMREFLEVADRDVRRKAWKKMADRRYADAEELDEIFDRMVELRHEIAENAGFDNYRDYVFAEKMRDYDPEACFQLHELIEEEVLPLAEEIVAWKKEGLGLESYKPWDGSADPEGRDPLEPFEEAEELKDGVEKMMRRLDGELGEQFGELREFMDLESRPGKEQGGFMMTFPASRRPFIFANASGRHSDVTTLLHESGHAFHTIASLPHQKMVSANIPMEFAEVASMAMELLHYDTLDEFYAEEDRQRAIKEHLRRIPMLLLSIARGDAFQHWMYTNPDHTAEQRREQWLIQRDRFQPFVDDSEVPRGWLRTGWHPILHFFQVPFYYIEYAFAQLGALQVAVNAEEDQAGALADYREALTLPPGPDTEELYATAGAEFVPTREKLSELMDWIRGQLFSDA